MSLLKTEEQARLSAVAAAADRALTEAARLATETARDITLLAQAETESARDEALNYGDARIERSWAALAAVTGMAAGDTAQVVSTDTGTHTDPVVGGAVSNAGVFKYSASPAGWERIADLQGQIASANAATTAVLAYLASNPFANTTALYAYSNTALAVGMSTTIVGDGRYEVASLGPVVWTRTGDDEANRAGAFAEQAAQSAAYAGGFETPEYASQSAGEAATTAGQIFRVPLGTTPQTFNWYRRLSSGSELVSPLATTAYAEDTYTKLVDYWSQAAGGVVTPAKNVIAGDPGNAVASDLGSCTISGGGRTGFENVIGGSVANVNTSTSNPVVTGTNANYSVITGGYDNVASGLASVISGFHNYTTTATTHGTISGGSVQKIVAGDYNTIGGGQVNEITAGDYCTIAGGGSHIINLPAGEDGSTISGGFDNTVTARYSTISGGYQNAASGVASTVSGGRFNTAGGADSTVSGGNTNAAGGDYSTILGGLTNTITGTTNGGYCYIGGGLSNTIASGGSARFSAIAGGRQNSINAEYASIFGGRENSVTAEAGVATGYGAVSNVPGMYSRANGYFAAAGDGQASHVTMRRITTDATATELRAGSTLGQRLSLVNDSVYAFSILVAARNTGADEGAAYKIEGCIQVTGAGATVLIGTPTVTVLGETVAGWECTVAADSPNKALQINVTGEAGKTIRWVADVWIVKVTG